MGSASERSKRAMPSGPLWRDWTWNTCFGSVDLPEVLIGKIVQVLRAQESLPSHHATKDGRTTRFRHLPVPTIPKARRRTTADPNATLPGLTILDEADADHGGHQNADKSLGLGEVTKSAESIHSFTVSVRYLALEQDSARLEHPRSELWPSDLCNTIDNLIGSGATPINVLPNSPGPGFARSEEDQSRLSYAEYRVPALIPDLAQDGIRQQQKVMFTVQWGRCTTCDGLY